MSFRERKWREKRGEVRSIRCTVRKWRERRGKVSRPELVVQWQRDSGNHFASGGGGSLSVKPKTVPTIQKTKVLEWVVFFEVWIDVAWSAATVRWSCPLHCKFLLVPFHICVMCWLMMKLLSFSSSFDFFCEQVGFLHVRFLCCWGKVIWWCYRECYWIFENPFFPFGVVCYRGVGTWKFWRNPMFSKFVSVSSCVVVCIVKLLAVTSFVFDF